MLGSTASNDDPSPIAPQADCMPAMPAALDAIGLRYVSDTMPGISRHRAGKGMFYCDRDGRRITDKATLSWIRSLAVPSAWHDVWISPLRHGHLLAAGRDQKGRKQYRYHPRWREIRDAAKFERMLSFAQALPRIRQAVDQDLKRRGLGRERVLALIVRLLETTLIRVGNDEYARTNQTFGLTTLRNRHLRMSGSELTFVFRGKSHKEHRISLRSRRLALLVHKIQELPGQELFQYLDEDGRRQPVDSGEVNDYLRQIAGGDFTAKDFRTWSATVLAAWALREFEAFDCEAAAKRNITQAIERVATRLGHTPTICRKSYVHPDIVGAYLAGELVLTLKAEVEQELTSVLPGLDPAEAAVLAFLQQRLGRAVREEAER